MKCTWSRWWNLAGLGIYIALPPDHLTIRITLLIWELLIDFPNKEKS